MSPDRRERNDDLESLIARYLEAEKSGQYLDRDALIEGHPEHADSLREFFVNHDQMKAAASLEEPMSPPSGNGLDDERGRLSNGSNHIWKKTCPSCERLIKVRQALIGRKFKCSKCEAVLTFNVEDPNGSLIHQKNVQHKLASCLPWLKMLLICLLWIMFLATAALCWGLVIVGTVTLLCEFGVLPESSSFSDEAKLLWSASTVGIIFLAMPASFVLGLITFLTTRWRVRWLVLPISLVPPLWTLAVFVWAARTWF